MQNLTNLDPDKLRVFAATGDDFRKTAEPLLDCWYDLLRDKLDFDLGQIVLHDNDWLGAILWRQARKQSYARDRYLGWHACQQASRLPLVAECIAFVPRLHVPDKQPDFGRISLNGSLCTLALDWADTFGYRPILASAELAPGGRLPPIFEATRWTRISAKDHRVAPSHWIMELVPGARKMLSARQLDKAFTGGTVPIENGLLPVKNELLSSLLDAFKDVVDPRELNRHYGVGSLLSIAFLALIAGSDSFGDVMRFQQQRLSDEQARLLGLPEARDLPTYHSYYRLFHRLDKDMILDKFSNWIETHKDTLPEVLGRNDEMMRDIIMIFANKLCAPPKPRRVV